MIQIKNTYKKGKLTLLNYFMILACSLAVFISSCQQDMVIEIKTNDKRLLVDGEFTNDTAIHTLNLYRSGSLITGTPQTIVSGAKIYLTDNIDTFYYTESLDTLGKYETERCSGVGGRTYFLSISNIDIDENGVMDSFTASSLMPVPVVFDSLVSERGIDGDGNMGVINLAYYKVKYNGPKYAFPILSLNTIFGMTLTKRLGSGDLTRDKYYELPKIEHPDSAINWSSYQSTTSTVIEGDTISFIIFNFTDSQFKFLQEFDNNTNGDPFLDNLFDELKVPSNLSTNIEPSDKAAGYFFIYSVSKIDSVFKEKTSTIYN